MNKTMKWLLASVALAAIAACGGGGNDGDAITDALNLTDPEVRYVNAADTPAPNFTLYRGTTAQADATNTSFGDSSNYFDVDTGAADWSTRTVGGTTTFANVNFDSRRGNRYTIIAAKDDDSSTGISNIVISDPSSAVGTSARVRVVNAAYNTDTLDVYIRPTTAQDISAVGPSFVPVAFAGVAPVSGARSTEINLPATRYQLIVTTTATKNTVFSEEITLTNNADWLIVLAPAENIPITANLIKALVIKTDDPGATQEITP